MSRQALPGILETTMRLSELTPTELADPLARAYAARPEEIDRLNSCEGQKTPSGKVQRFVLRQRRRMEVSSNLETAGPIE